MFICNDSIPLSKEEKEEMITKAAEAYANFMKVLRIDIENDENSKDTPKRVAKMYIEELFKGRYEPKPNIQSFPNTKRYNQMIFTNCEVVSVCAHHHIPIQNKVFIGVLTNPSEDSRLIGLSKYTRIVEWIAARPTIQEEMTQQIHDEINLVCEKNLGVMVYVIGQHGCTVYRGVKQINSRMITSSLSGAFKENSVKAEFMNMVNSIITRG